MRACFWGGGGCGGGISSGWVGLLFGGGGVADVVGGVGLGLGLRWLVGWMFYTLLRSSTCKYMYSTVLKYMMWRRYLGYAVLLYIT